MLGAGRRVRTAVGAGLGGEVTRQVLTLGSFEIADWLFKGVAAAIDSDDSASDFKVGISVLRRFRITTEFSDHLIWLEARD